MREPSRFEIVEVGPVARRALAPGATGEVRAVFERSFYAVLDGRWVCFGPRGLGAGPLNALYARGPAAGWHGRLAVGQRAHVAAEALGQISNPLRAVAACGSGLETPTPTLSARGARPHTDRAPLEPKGGGSRVVPQPTRSLPPPPCGETGEQALAPRGQRAPRAGWGGERSRPSAGASQTDRDRGWPENRQASQMPAGRSSCEIHIGNLIFGFRSAVTWTPVGCAAADPEALAAGLRALDAMLPSRIPQDGLAALINPEIRRERLSAVARIAEDAARYLGNLVQPAATGPDLVRLLPLIGLGPGLTPSGDDVVGGALVAMRCLGLEDLADAIRAWLETAAPGRTNDISLAHLAAAAEGFGSAALHGILRNLLQGRSARLGAALTEIDSTGHTSGWDALAGAAIVLRAWLDAHRHAASGTSHAPAPDSRSGL